MVPLSLPEISSLQQDPALERLEASPLGLALLGWLGLAEHPGLDHVAAEAIARLERPGRSPDDLAVLGFSLGTRGGDRVQHTIFEEELTELSRQRFFVPHQPRIFEDNGDALLGVAVGARTACPEGVSVGRTWLADDLLLRVVHELPARSWARLAASAGRVILGSASEGVPPDVLVALAARGVAFASLAVHRASIAEIRAASPCLSPAHAALRLVAAYRLAEQAASARVTGAMGAPARPEVALMDLLSQCFTVDELRDLVFRLPEAARLRSKLLEGAISPEGFARHLVELLQEQGLVDDALFSTLRERRPGMDKEIVALALRFPTNPSSQLRV